MGKFHDQAEQYRDNLESMAASYSRRDGSLVAWNRASWTFPNVDAWAGGRGVPPLIVAGDNVLVDSRGYIRPGKVLAVGRKYLKVGYITPGGIEEAKRAAAAWAAHGQPKTCHAPITVISVLREELAGWDPQPARRG